MQKVSRFSVGKFLSHSGEKFCRGTFLCFRNSLVSKNVRDKRRGGYHAFPSKLFCLTVPKNFVGEPFGVSEYFWYRKILCIRGGREGGSQLLLKSFCLTVPKNIVGEPFSVSLISGIEKVYASEGYVTIFCRKFFVSQCRKIS